MRSWCLWVWMRFLRSVCPQHTPSKKLSTTDNVIRQPEHRRDRSIYMQALLRRRSRQQTRQRPEHIRTVLRQAQLLLKSFAQPRMYTRRILKTIGLTHRQIRTMTLLIPMLRSNSIFRSNNRSRQQKTRRLQRRTSRTRIFVRNFVFSKS